MSNARLNAPNRLALLRLLDLLRPHADASLDRVTAIASAATGSPIALLTFVGPDGQWLGSHHGLAANWQPLSQSFCVHTLDDAQPLEIRDAAIEERFWNNPLVADGVRFYAGHPVVFDNEVLGTVCVLDRRPRSLDQAQATTLAHLAELVADLLRVRFERSRAVQAEADRTEIEERFRRSQKLESIGVLAGGIAHDFNNILGAILGHVDLAHQDAVSPGAPQPSTHSLEQIRKACLRGRDMVQQILAFAKQRPAARGPCDIREVVDETLALLRPMAPPWVLIGSRMSDEALFVKADSTQIEQALINLCVNAWQAMRSSPGRIEVKAKRQRLARPADEGMEIEPGAYVCIEVRDDGPGMDQATAAHAFEAFFTTKPEGQGTGLGLAMVHGIATRHGGSVTLTTSPGQGACFCLWLPVDDAGELAVPRGVDAGVSDAAWSAANLSNNPNTHSVPVRADAPLVFYVDDDDVMRALVPDILARSGYRVACHGSGADALAGFLQSPHTVAAVITDLHMPGMSGLDLMHALRQRQPDLPVIIATGDMSPELATELSAAGAARAFGKQHVTEELASLLASVVPAQQRQPDG